MFMLYDKLYFIERRSVMRLMLSFDVTKLLFFGIIIYGSLFFLKILKGEK